MNRVVIVVFAAVLGVAGGLGAYLLTNGDDGGTTEQTVVAAADTDTSTEDSNTENSNTEETGADAALDDLVACAEAATQRAGTPLVLVEGYETERFIISICTAADGALWYHGEVIDGDADAGSVSLPTERHGITYVATTADGYEYVVDGHVLMVTEPDGTELVNAALTQTFPVQ